MNKPQPTLIILIFVMACVVMPACNSQASVAQTPLPVLTQIPMLTLSPAYLSNTAVFVSTPSPTILPLPTSTVLPTSPQIHAISPKIVKACSTHPEVPLEELGLDPHYLLVLASYDEILGYGYPTKTGVWTISANHPITQEIPDTMSKDGWKLYNYGPSPSGRWLDLRYQKVGTDQVSYWRSSWDGQEQWEILNLSLKEGSAVSVSDEEMFVIGIPEDKQQDEDTNAWKKRQPLLRINPLNLDLKTLPSLPENAIHAEYFMWDNTPFDLYFDGTTPYFDDIALYSYADSKSTPVFQWLVRSEGVDFHTTDMSIRKDGLFSVVVNRPYGFDFAVDLDMDTIKQPKDYNEIMKAVVFAGENNNNTSIFTVVLPQKTKDMFPIYWVNGLDDLPTTTLYMFDYHRNIITDYCLSIGENSNLEFSPDERFVAVTIFEDSITSGKPDYYAKETLVIDAQTGRFTRIEGVKAIGWGITP